MYPAKGIINNKKMSFLMGMDHQTYMDLFVGSLSILGDISNFYLVGNKLT